ncbi:unnamed protein product [Paramecium pentaurelia]|uniref:Uncharacterized protein n=1 Tax=Paramecium pentaurelia TaxID=43138 RepID=A0A8S1VGZ2_9CILI|nr:unnamed protein product [Paramecium pentaurelia]
MHSTQQMSKFSSTYSTNYNTNTRRYVSSAKTSPMTGPLQKLIETDNDNFSKRDKNPQNLLQEILYTNNITKIQKLISTFTQHDLNIDNLSQQELLNIILKVYQLNLYEEINFINILYEAYTDKQHKDVLKYLILHCHEQLIGKSGNTTRLLEIFQEMLTLNPDFTSFQLEYQLDSIPVSFSRIQLRCMFLLNQYDILRSLKGAVALFEQLEGFIFQQFKSNTIPTQSDISTLVIAYILLSEQLELCNRHGLNKQALEIIGKPIDCSIIDLKRKFIYNASKLSQKYLGQMIFDQINGLHRKMSPDLNRSQIVSQDTIIHQFLLDSLDMVYLKTYKDMFDIDRLSTNIITQPYVYTLMEKILPESKKKDKVLSILSDDQIRPNSGKQFQIKQIKSDLNSPNQSKFKQQNFNVLSNNNSQTQIPVITTNKPISNRPPLNQQLSSGSLHSSGKLNQFDSQEFEIIQNKLVIQQRELDELKQLYTLQLTTKKQEPENNQLAEQMKKKIDQLENNLFQIKNENSINKKEKEQKQNEVIELKTQLQDLITKQSQLEKLLQSQSQQQQMIIYQQNLLQQQQQAAAQTTQSLNQQQSNSIIQTASMNIQIPPKEAQKHQNILNHSPDDDFIQMDDTTPYIYKQNQSYIIQLLEMLDINIAFAKMYTRYQSASQDENDQWNSDIQNIANYRVEATVVETRDEGKSILLKSFDEKNSLLCQENINLELLKGLITYVDFQEMLPTNQPSINTTHQFFKFLVLPYTAVVPDEITQEMKLQFWPKPYGLLNGLTLRIDFMDKNCLIYIHHIETDQFRISICDPISKDTLRLDLEMDYSTMDSFFKDAKSIKDQYAYFSKTTLLKMTEKTPKFGDDDVAEALQEKHFDKNKVKQIQQSISLNQTYMVENLIFKNPKEFLKYLKTIVIQFEQYLKSLGISFSNTLFGQKYFRCKSWNTGSKNQLQIVLDNQDQQNIQVCLQNCFETFGPNKTKIKAKGLTTLPYSSIQREFSVMFDKLQSEEKIVIFQQLLYSFNLNVFDKACEQSQEQFDKNPIIQNSYDCGSYKRMILYDNSKISVVTISVIGANRRMCGVKFSVFNIETTQEIGVYLPTSQGEWDLRSLDKQKIKSSVENVPFAEFFLTQILRCPITTQILFKKILKADSKNNQINSNEIKNRKAFIERIDNLITWQEVLAAAQN